MTRTHLVLGLILLLFFVTRIYKISDIPISVYWDEASIGYNAYSILKTGADEWGEFLPLHFRAFGEFKLPVYIYSVVPFVWLMGLNEAAVRLPAVMYSAMSVVLIYLITKKITADQTAALFSAFFLAVSPGFYIFSRTGYEASAGVMFYLLGIYLLFLFKNNWLVLILSGLSFAASFYSYNSFRIMVPLTIPVLLYYLWRFQKLPTKAVGLAAAIFFTIFILAAIPMVKLVLYDSGAARLQTVGLNELSLKLVSNYFSHFDPRYLFIAGDINQRSQQTGFSQLYLPDLLLLILGLIFVVRQRNPILTIILLLILLSPIPASITRESPHALRSISLAVFLPIICAVGLSSLLQRFKSQFTLLIVVIVYLGFFGNYYYHFLTGYPISSASSWQYEYKKIFTEYRDDFEKYDHVIVSAEYGQPYIFGLFYLKYDPIKLRSEAEYNHPGPGYYTPVRSFSNFIFTKINRENLPTGKNLVLAHPSEKLTEMESLEDIYFPDGRVMWHIYVYTR